MGGVKFEFTQISFASEVKDWINEIIKSEGLRFEHADIEMKDPSKRRADLIVWEKRVVKPALLIEIWDASTPPWENALDSALSKAWKNNIPYFVVWNLIHFYCWDTFEKGTSIDKLWWPHAGVNEIVCKALSYYDAMIKYKDDIKSYLKSFLREFEDIYYSIRAKPLLGIDERLRYRDRGTIHAKIIPALMDTINVLNSLTVTEQEQDTIDSIIDSILRAPSEEEAYTKLSELEQMVKRRLEQGRPPPSALSTPTPREPAILRRRDLPMQAYIDKFKALRATPEFKPWWNSLDPDIKESLIQTMRADIEMAKAKGLVVTEENLNEFYVLIEELRFTNVRKIHYYIVSKEDDLPITSGPLYDLNYASRRIPQLLDHWRPAYAIIIY